jgi:predicted metalloprotease
MESQYGKVETPCCADGGTTDSTGSSSSGVTTGIAVAVILGVILLIAMLVIFVLFVVVIIVMVKLHSKSNGGNYRRVPVSSSPEEERLTFRNLQEPINSGGDEDDDNPLPL